MDIHEIEIKVEPDAQRGIGFYLVRLKDSATSGEITVSRQFVPPMSSEQLRGLIEPCCSLNPQGKFADVKKAGSEMGELFAFQNLKEIWREQFAPTASFLRLRLIFENCGELETLPWEAIAVRRHPHTEYLLSTGTVSLVRTNPGRSCVTPTAVNTSLRMLIFISTPKYHEAVYANSEERLLKKLCISYGVELKIIRNGRLDKLMSIMKNCNYSGGRQVGQNGTARKDRAQTIQ